MNTVEEVGYIYEKAKELMVEREKDYEGSWRREGLASAISSLFKKASQLQQMYLNGRLMENPKRALEDTLDAQNYGVFIYRHIELLNNSKEEEK